MGKIKNQYLYTENTFYHIYNRGNDKRLIFLDTRDYARFITNIKKYEKGYGLIVYAYCLMPNHYHMLIQLGSNKGDISKFMHQCMTAYSMYFNKKYDRVGRICQSPFQASRLPTIKSIVKIFEYIKDNPVKAGLVKASEDYRWLDISLEQPKCILEVKEK